VCGQPKVTIRAPVPPQVAQSLPVGTLITDIPKPRQVEQVSARRKTSRKRFALDFIPPEPFPTPTGRLFDRLGGLGPPALQHCDGHLGSDLEAEPPKEFDVDGLVLAPPDQELDFEGGLLDY
jgi:hypothetical protein